MQQQLVKIIFLSITFAALCFSISAKNLNPSQSANSSEFINPTVYEPFVNGLHLDIPNELAGNRLAKWGMLDVTQSPFSADPTGKVDSTKALQSAINYARNHQLVCFFPEGIYRISDTLTCVQKLYRLASGKLVSGRSFPCVLVGSRKGKRPVIYLAPNSRGFNSSNHPKYVIHFWARNKKNPKKPQPNISFNQIMVNIDITIGEGNSGAVAVRHRAAQGSGIQDCTIDATHGLTGIEGGAGSGGSFTGIKVIGGKFGLDLRQTQPAPTIAGITLIDQSENAILYRGRQALSAVGIKIQTSVKGPVVKGLSAKWNPHEGQMCFIDSEIIFKKTNGVAFSAARNLYLKNVYIKNALFAVSNPDGSEVAGKESGWLHIKEYAHGTNTPKFKGYFYKAPVYIDGKRSQSDVLTVDETLGPPKDLQSKHLWNTPFPSMESAGIVNIKMPPYNAKGDGKADDTAALQKAIDENEIIFLPKGYYSITSTLKLKSNTKLIGVGRHLSVIMSNPAKWKTEVSLSTPLLLTPDKQNTEVILAFLGLYVHQSLSNVYLLHWQSGGKSLLRAVNFMTLPYFQERPRVRDIPLVVISASGGGKWYNFFQEDTGTHGRNYRHLLVKGTLGPLKIYQCNPEHAKSETNMEIRDSQNVTIYGLKGELRKANALVLKIVSSDYISIFGYGGNAQAYKGGSLISIFNTPNFLFANLVDHPLFHPNDPTKWYAIVDRPSSEIMIKTNPLDRPVLYRRGSF